MSTDPFKGLVTAIRFAKKKEKKQFGSKHHCVYTEHLTGLDPDLTQKQNPNVCFHELRLPHFSFNFVEAMLFKLEFNGAL